MSSRPELLRRAEEYSKRKGSTIGQPFGSGVHGSVFGAENQSGTGSSAIKVHERERDYCRERDVYLHLQKCAVTDIRGSTVPELLDYDDELWVLEMTVVTPPFVLDFAGAYLDFPPDFSEEVLADWRSEKLEQFGPRWPEVQAILRALEGYGIFMVDVHPGNVSFGD